MLQWVIIFLAILLNVCGHIFLKAGMNKIGLINPLLLISDFKKVFFTTPFVLLGISSYVASVALYMVVLSRTYLSFAYPLMMSTGYVLIVFFSWQVFKEPFNFYKWVGMGLILIGVLLIGK
ncbi:MAG TPA: SMR family transporter [candidate division Zixibacteria bacterium]